MTTHTELAAQARRLALFIGAQVLETKAHHHEGLSEAALCLTRCAAALESTERLAGGGEPSWEDSEGWESLAWELCADENGEDSCNELIWEGGPVPEPWGERWLKYEDEAKRLIALVHKHVPQAERVPLSDAEIAAITLQTVYEGDTGIAYRMQWIDSVGIPFARAIERAHGITPKEGT
ncbi:hypothetical protein [Hydrogenophaga sp.]